MNEAQIRDRLRKAVGETKYPPYLLSRIEAQLNHSERQPGPRAFPRASESRWLVGTRRIGSLVAALLVVLLIGALVIGVQVMRNGELNTRSSPAGKDIAIKNYQAMVDADLQRWNNATGYDCSTFGDPQCLTEIGLANAALRHWLDDLDRSQPPGRFATLAGHLRRHIANAISENDTFAAAYAARDSKLANTIFNPTVSGQIDAVEREAGDIVASSPGTSTTYKAQVHLDRSYLLACGLCQQLRSQTQVSCQASHAPTCADVIGTIRLQVEIFEGDVVRLYTPDILASKDARLQADLVTADGALDAMETALSTGDQASLETGQATLRQALSRVDADAADIAGGN
jgi:hypothetical protein